MTQKDPAPQGGSEFLRSVRNGAIIGALLLVVLIPWMRSRQAPPPPAQPPVAQAPAPAPAAPGAPAAPEAPAAPQAPVFPGLLADFGDEQPSPEARHVADWAFFTGDNERRAVIVLDKKMAKVFTFDPQGKLIAAAPALLGSAIGDDSAPGIGSKPLSQIRPEERTTPAGRFVARPGLNNHREDIVWIDYDAAVSMHRIRPVLASERRFERLASATHEDNRISNGCVNLPVPFYEKVISPTVKSMGAIIYVLPETRTAQEVFGSFDVHDAQAVAEAAASVRPYASRTELAAATPLQARSDRSD